MNITLWIAKSTTKFAALALMAVGALVLFGWALDIQTLKSVRPGLVVMKANTALCFTLAGASLYIGGRNGAHYSTPQRKYAALACAMVVALVGLLTISEYVFGLNLGIDQMLFKENAGAVLTSQPGRMSIVTAINFLLLGSALMLPDGRRAWISIQLLAFAATWLSLLSLFGYMYQAPTLYVFSFSTSIAQVTVFCFFILSAGILCSRPERGLVKMLTNDTIGGAMARRLMPIAVIIPIILGWVYLLGVEADVVSPQLGIALATATTVSVFTLLFWWNARQLDAEDIRRERAEEEIRRAKEFADSVLGSMLDGLVTLDPHGVCFDTNPAFCQITGFSRDEIIGTRLLGPIGPPEELEKIEAFFQKFLREGMSENIDLTFMRKNGERFPAILSLSVVKDVQGNVTACLVAIKDITLRRRAEEQRDRLFNTSIDMVCIAGFDGYFKQLNPSWQRVLGWKPEDLMSKPFLDFVHPDDREPTIAAASGLSEGRTVITFENRYLCSDGSYRWISWNSVPIMEEKLILAIVRDVTDQKRMEESLGEANKVLTHQAAELEFVNKELETFSYSVSHDLRAPLRHIDGFSHALLEDYADKLDAQGKDYLNRIRSGSQRMALLIDEILKLSQIVREKMVTSRVDLSALARSVASELQKSQPTRDVSLRIEDGIVVNGDQGLLKIVLDNLLGNAWKFTQGRQKALIEFGSQMIDGTKTYFVRDNGAGFDMAYASKLFVPFQRLHGNGEFQGTGIGLSIAQRVIRRHGGRIWAEAAVDAGATFYFTLSRTTRSLKR